MVKDCKILSYESISIIFSIEAVAKVFFMHDYVMVRKQFSICHFSQYEVVAKIQFEYFSYGRLHTEFILS